MTKDKALQLISDEYSRAVQLFPRFNSRHEGYAVLLEEVDELWDAIKSKDGDGNDFLEAIQVGAMALRLLTDCFDDITE